MEMLEQKIARVAKEEVAIVPYDTRWPEMFRKERLHLQSCLPADLVVRAHLSLSLLAQSPGH